MVIYIYRYIRIYWYHHRHSHIYIYHIYTYNIVESNPSPDFYSFASRLDIRASRGLGAIAPRCALRAISALRASVRVSRKLGCFAPPCESLFARPTFAPLERKSCLRHALDRRVGLQLIYTCNHIYQSRFE